MMAAHQSPMIILDRLTHERREKKSFPKKSQYSLEPEKKRSRKPQAKTAQPQSNKGNRRQDSQTYLDWVPLNCDAATSHNQLNFYHLDTLTYHHSLNLLLHSCTAAKTMSHLNASYVSSINSSASSFRPAFIAPRRRGRRRSGFPANSRRASVSSSFYQSSKFGLEEW